MVDPIPSVPPVLQRRYAVERELGRGGMGTVYLAHDRKHGRPVAIKVLPPDLAAALGPEQFLREIGIAARLSHPHILPLHDSGQAGGILFYVMPFIEGESLRQRLERPPALPVEQALAIAREVADALAYAHSQGVIHRDVKPGNILLHQGHALLGDFGVARMQGDGPITDSGMPIGTAAYASPEQAAGSRLVDQRSDVYGLGCVLYEMLAGPEANVQDLLQRRFAEPLPRLGRLRPGVPQWVEGCVDQALAPHPDQRCTVAELRDRLAGPIAATGRVDAAVAARARNDSRRRRLLWMGSGATGVALIGAAVAFLPGRGENLDPKRVVVAGFDNRTGDSTQAPIGDIATDYIARGLAETRLLHEVYDLRAVARESGEPPRTGPGPGRELGRQVGAGTVLWGSYYRDRDSLHFESELVDASSGRVILSLKPAVGPLDDPVQAVETLRQRVMGAFTAVFQSAGFEPWEAASVPPTYEAYQEMLAGAAAAWAFDNEEAARHYRRAAELDSSYVGPKAALALVLEESGDCRGTDSIARLLEPVRGQLLPVDRGSLDWATAQCRGDLDGAVEASRAVVAAAPASVGSRILGAVMALEAFRPHDALRFLQPLAAKRHQLTGTPAAMYGDLLHMAYHMAGDYGRELREGGGGSALAALGRLDAAQALLDAQLSGTESDADSQGALCLALEVRAHGHPREALDMVRRVSAWHAAHPDVDPVPDGKIPCLWLLLSTRYYAGDSATARAEYERVLARDSANLEAWAGLGALAARSGDQAAASRIDRGLAARTDRRGMATYDRARIAAILDDRDRAVSLLTQAFQEGLRGRMSVHLDPDFESLRQYAPYQAITRLRDEE
jgi:tetratricopeptide (TPR) repeat protein/TolB-like protein